MSKLTLEKTANKSFDLPGGQLQVGTFGCNAAGKMVIIFDPAFVRCFDADQLETVISMIGDYLRAVHGQGLPQ